MLDTLEIERLHRGESIHLDCSAARHISVVCYQETGPTKTPRCETQIKKIEINAHTHTPPSGQRKSAGAQFTCTTSSTKAATCAASAQACNSHISGSVATHTLGATSAEVEVTRRNYALLIRRILQSKLQLAASHSRQKTSLTSTAESAVPALTQQLSCKANITTDFCRRLVLQTELQWKPKLWETNKEKTMPLGRTANHDATQAEAQQCASDTRQPHNLDYIWTSLSPSTLPWSCTPLPTPPPIYAHKQRAGYSRGTTEDKGTKQSDADHQGSAGSQCTLQVKGSPGGSPGGKARPSWHLKVQKSLRRKTQLRGQISALLVPVTLWPSRWQIEARHRLPKGASFHARLQGEAVQQAGGCSTNRHRLLLERKACDAWWTCTCAHDSTGWQLGLRAKASSGRSKASRRHYTVKFTTNMHMTSGRCHKFSHTADLSVSVSI